MSIGVASRVAQPAERISLTGRGRCKGRADQAGELRDPRAIDRGIRALTRGAAKFQVKGQQLAEQDGSSGAEDAGEEVHQVRSLDPAPGGLEPVAKCVVAHLVGEGKTGVVGRRREAHPAASSCQRAWINRSLRSTVLRVVPSSLATSSVVRPSSLRSAINFNVGSGSRSNRRS